MLSREDMLKNINELYDAFRMSDPERVRLKGLNAALRKEIERLPKPREIEMLKAEIESLKKTIDSLDTPTPKGIAPLSELPRELMLIKAPGAGGLVADCLKRIPLNERYKFYVGYLYERKDWHVQYDDDKRITCEKDSRLIVIATEDGGIINHNTVYALAARALAFKMDNPNLEVSALCITSKTISNKARIIAQKFSIAVKENFQFQNFPYVKCKILQDGRRAYYTPNDTEYFTAQIITANGDFFCHNVNDKSPGNP